VGFDVQDLFVQVTVVIHVKSTLLTRSRVHLANTEGDETHWVWWSRRSPGVQVAKAESGPAFIE
jgi:hypothetical protein